MSEHVIEVNGLNKSYQDGRRQVPVLQNLSLTLARGRGVAIVGASGSGKSTLLHLLGGLDDADSGTICVCGTDIGKLTVSGLARFRNRHLGFVYQFHHLLNEFSALENAAMPLLIRGWSATRAHKQAQQLLERVGLGHRLNHRPSELSGGERQRVAIARALVGEPDVLLADEPTGNLDQATAAQVYELLQQLQAELQISILIVTHDLALASQLDQQWQLCQGQLRPLELTEGVA